jgi:signal transduction histidine kinase
MPVDPGGVPDCCAQTAILERARLANLLHDDVGQILTAAGLQLELLRQDLASSAPACLPALLETQTLVGRVIESVRCYSKELSAT